MTSNWQPVSVELVDSWLTTRLSARVGGRTVDLDAIAGDELLARIEPAMFPLCLVTAHNPMAEPQPAIVNRRANRHLRLELDDQERYWFPAVGRAADGSWSEPGFLLPVSSEDQVATLGADLHPPLFFHHTLLETPDTRGPVRASSRCARQTSI